MYKNGTFLSPNHLNSCLNEMVPTNVTRSKFHVSNGRVVFDLVNGTQGNAMNDHFGLDMYLPHLYYQYVDPPNGTRYNVGAQGTYKMGRTMWRYKDWLVFCVVWGVL